MGMWKTDLTIREAINRIKDNKMLLPAIQRKYVWSEDQIIELMDSILRGYPIGTFLIWKTTVASAKEKKYSFYRFITDYHERDACVNEPLSITTFEGAREIYSVLDGQQRLNSLLIAIDGSYAVKLPRKHRNNPDAFPRKQLYFNLLSGEEKDFGEDSGRQYEFAFFEEMPGYDEAHLWLKVPDLLWIDLSKPVGFVKGAYGTLGYDDETLYEVILENLVRLQSAICKEEKILTYFEVETDDMDEVLDIFVRANSGGTVLSKSDLLFSTIVSFWQDARKEFEALIKKVNDKGFRIDSDFVVHVCLMLLDRNVNLKVRNLDKDTVKEIKNRWKAISNATLDTFGLLKSFGSNDEYLSSYNAVIPIVYLAYKGCDLRSSKDEIQKYLAIAQAKQLFSRSSNSTLTAIRAALREQDGGGEEYRLKQKVFSRSQLDGITVGPNDFQMNDKDIEALFFLGKGARAFTILSLLYPHLKLGEIEFHMDHLHPTAGFDDNNFDCPGISPKKHAEWKEICNTLPNLQLLEGRENQSKNKMPLSEWIKREDNLRQVRYVPEGTSYEVADFDEFMRVREAEMTKELRRIFE